MKQYDEFENDPPESMRSNEKNSTTFEKCGWCKYASGTHRYDYMIHGNCSLIPKYHVLDREFTWNSDCALKGMSKLDLKSLIDSKKYKIENSKQAIEDQIEHIKILKKKFAKNVTNSPCFPNHREVEHFKLNEEIFSFYENEWHKGKVE